MNITKSTLGTLAFNGRETTYFDDTLKGFGVRVGKSGQSRQARMGRQPVCRMFGGRAVRRWFGTQSDRRQSRRAGGIGKSVPSPRQIVFFQRNQSKRR